MVFRPFLRVIGLFALALMAAGPVRAQAWPEPPRLPVPDAAEQERLDRGEVVIRDTHLDEAGGAALAHVLFRADVARVWATLGDCQANFVFVRGLQACELLEDQPTHARTRQRVKPFRLLPALDYVFETVRDPHHWIRIRAVEGDLRQLEGSWRFLPQADGAVLVTHEIQVQTRMPVPRWLARRTVHRDMERLLLCLRWATEAWPEGPQRGRDRAACPGPADEPLDPLAERDAPTA